MAAHPHTSSRPSAQWLHLLLLLLLVSVLQAGQRLVGVNSALDPTVFARALYAWLPALAGIAISIGGPHAKIDRSGLLMGLVVTALMIGLDVTRAVAIDSDQTTALFPDASLGPMAQASSQALVSWVETALAWIRGDLVGVGDQGLSYQLEHPRFRAAHAMTEGGYLLLVFASIGVVIAAMSWVRAHVVFTRPEDARAFHVVLAWLLSPLVVEISRRLSEAQGFRALFQGAALWRPLVPHVATLLATIFLWWYTRRYRETGDE